MPIVTQNGDFVLLQNGDRILFQGEEPIEEDVKVQITYNDEPDPIANGTTIQFEEVEQDGETQTLVLHVENVSDEDLTISLQAPGSGFEILSFPSTIAVGETEDIVIRSVTAVPGEYLRYITIHNFTVQFSIIVAPNVAVYTTREKLERCYGAINIKVWADLNGTEDPNEIEQVVFESIKDVSREIDTYLSNGLYETPFTLPYPNIIEQMATKMAGVHLYTSRGFYVESYDKLTSMEMKNSRSWLEDIRRGRIRLSEVQPTRVSTAGPFVVNT